MPIESADEVVFQGGPAGADGQSTYQAWLALGNVGSIADFIAAQRGAPGPTNVLAIGTVSTGAPGSSASASITGVSPNQTLNLSVPQGATGAQPWQTPPTAWAASTAYTATAPASSVIYGGESYVCAASHTSAQAFDASKWTKLAQKGADGSPAAGAVLYNAAQSLDPIPRRQAKINIRTEECDYVYLTSATNHAADVDGKLVLVDGDVLQTLPQGSTFAYAGTVTFRSVNGYPFTIAAYAGDTINLAAPAVSSFRVYPGGEVRLYWTGYQWTGALQAPALSALLTDRAQTFTDAQKSQLLTNAGLLIPQAQCRLVRNSATQLQLVGWNGNRLWINGSYRTISNVLTGNNGLSANQFVYAFAYWTGSAVALALGIAAPTWDPLYGIRVANGQGSDAANRVFTYVGAILTDANGQFRDDDTFRGVASLFNPPRRTLAGIIAANGSTASTQGVTLGTALQFALAEPTGCDFSTAGYTQNETGGQFCRTDITLDQVAAGYPCLATSAIANADCAISAHYAGALPDGAHAINLFGTVSGGTGHWNAALFGVLG